MNLIGAFLSIKVATTIATGIVDAKALTLTMVFAALIGAIAWNLVTWALSLPSSSSHALVGGVVGAAIAAIGTGAVKGDTLVEKVIVPAILSPVIAGLVAIAGTAFAYVMVARLREGDARRGYRVGQIGSASLVSLAHGTNDSQKTMGIITLALIAHGNLDADNFTVPLWVKIGCGVAIAAGTYVGGWRIINTMGNRLTEIEAPQGFAAESSGASVILASSYFGYPLSTTHVVSGAVVGSGIEGNAGPVNVGLIAAGLAAVLYVVTQRTPVRANDLDRSHADARSLADGRSGGRMIPASSLIDFDALWKIVVAGFAGGAGVVVAFGFVLLGRSHYAQAREGDVVSRGASVLLAALGGVLCAAALIVGFIALTKK